MAAFFTAGEQKARPGMYVRYENAGAPPAAGADDGRCAAVLASDWGPLGEPVLLAGPEDVARVFGGGGEGGTTAAADAMFQGGARQVVAVRLGEGGSRGEADIMDAGGEPAIRLTLRHPGSRRFSLSLRPSLDSPGKLELALLEGAAAVERHAFDGHGEGGQARALMEAAAGSEHFTLEALGDGGLPLAAASQQEIPPGKDPEVTAGSYSRAFEALEAHRWNALALDTSDPGALALVQPYLERAYRGGKFAMGVVGEGRGVPFAERLAHAKAYNDYKVVYVGTGFVDAAGAAHDGWRAAARVAGMIAGAPSSESLTHRAVAGASGLSEPLSSHQHELAAQAGMLTFSASGSGAVWVEQGINTLSEPGPGEDRGWTKIKRAKARFELFQRIADTVEGLVGRVDNDPDGRAAVVQAANGVCNAMAAEKKLLPGARCELDAGNPPQGDSAWFVVHADDVDALERQYYAFRFRFAPEA